jgi:uncharacterized OsmC-like protein
MNSDELKSLQAPLKEKYRTDPTSATVTLRAEAKLGDGVSCSIQTGKVLIEAGLHPATGGTGTQACSGDMLLQSLAACAGVTLAAVATVIGVKLLDATVRAEGDLDFRGTLGVSKEAPVGFQSIRLSFNLDTRASNEEVAKLLELTERYCVVLQTLKRPACITATAAVRK